MSNTDCLDPQFLIFDDETPELLGFATTLRERIAAGLDFQADISESLDAWVPYNKPRSAPSGKPRFVSNWNSDEEARHPGQLARRWLLPAWLGVRVLGPREGKAACAVITYHNGFSSQGAGVRAADSIERAVKSVCGASTTVVRIALDEKPKTAYQATGGLPPFATLLRYRKAEDAEKAAAFWKGDAGAGAGFLWYPSAGHDTRPLAWFLPRADVLPRAKVDYFVLSGLGDPALERLMRSTLRNGAAGKVLFQDRVSCLSVIESVPFSFDEERVLWYVGDPYTFRDGNEQPVVRGVNGLLIRTKFESTTLGTFEQNLVYVEMENSAFELEIVREGFLNPVVYCAVRDGCGFGGNRRCENSLRHIEDLIESRTFTPAWWVTDHLHYLDDAGLSRSYRSDRHEAGGNEGLMCDLSPRLWINAVEEQYGAGFLSLYPGRMGGGAA